MALCLVLTSFLFGATQEPRVPVSLQPIEVGPFSQDVAHFYTIHDGLPSDDIRSIAVTSEGTVCAVTPSGMAILDGDRWTSTQTDRVFHRVTASPDGRFHFLVDGTFTSDITSGLSIPLPDGLDMEQVHRVLAAHDTLMIATDRGVYVATGNQPFTPEKEWNTHLGEDLMVHDIAMHCPGEAAIGAVSGLFHTHGPLYPVAGDRSWKPVDVRCVAYDASGGLWMASPQGVAAYRGDEWRLWTGADGLPFNDFTSMATGPRDEVWFGTTRGAIRFANGEWSFRQGQRWLPDDHVREVAIGPDGTAWFATAAGVGCIRPEPMTLREKAAYFESEIDLRHRRTPMGYVLEVRLDTPGDRSSWVQTDSDNDGLWTAMYGAGACFAYGATGDPMARKRATDAFEALRFLGTVTQGGQHPAPPGYVARTILPASEGNPNAEAYTPEKDRQRKASHDAAWKVMDPRWPLSADGEWYWKSDTSSDELDGHYFLNALYYDLVAESEAEKASVREQVRSLTDHLLAHDFSLVDHDGLPTRWAIFSPTALNTNPQWFAERGLNSLSILSYLAVAGHVTGDPKYREATMTLINEHGFAQNLMVPKIHNGAGSGNHSDDEMAFMCFYNLIKYEQDPELRAQYAFSLYRYWRIEKPEVNPFFDFVYAVCCDGLSFTDAFGDYPLIEKDPSWLATSVAELRRFPLDRVDWAHDNSFRLDAVPLPDYAYLFDTDERSGEGWRVDGRVFPCDERHFNHWNHNPWTLTSGGDGHTLATGTVYLLPYYMGLYHGLIREQTTP